MVVLGFFVHVPVVQVSQSPAQAVSQQWPDAQNGDDAQVLADEHELPGPVFATQAPLAPGLEQ
jgi:hypothetical protein